MFKRLSIQKTKWREGDHPRDETGKFVSGPAVDSLVQKHGRKFVDALENTPGVAITPEGIRVETSRYQEPSASGTEAVRTGVFFFPEKHAPLEDRYNTKDNDFGGSQKVEGETVLKNPFVTEAIRGGKLAANAYDSVMGAGAYEKMRKDFLWDIAGQISVFTPPKKANALVGKFLAKYGADPNTAPNLVKNTAQDDAVMAYAVQENIVAHAMRKAGYDSILSYSKHRGKQRLTELFDLRMTHNPK